MDPKNFVCPDTGKIIRTPEGYHAFVPAPPSEISYDADLVAALSHADAAVSELSGLGCFLPMHAK